MGMISEPVIPNIQGMDSFQGPIFHSSRWPEDLEWQGKRIGIIGAGATTVQMVPVMAKEAASVTGIPAHTQLHPASPCNER